MMAMGLALQWTTTGCNFAGYYITRDNKLILASDAGLLDAKDVDIIEKGQVSIATASPKRTPRSRESVSM